MTMTLLTFKMPDKDSDDYGLMSGDSIALAIAITKIHKKGKRKLLFITMFFSCK